MNSLTFSLEHRQVMNLSEMSLHGDHSDSVAISWSQFTTSHVFLMAYKKDPLSNFSFKLSITHGVNYPMNSILKLFIVLFIIAVIVIPTGKLLLYLRQKHEIEIPVP